MCFAEAHALNGTGGRRRPPRPTEKDQALKMDFIELDGVTLRYELSGKGDRTLVLVHEMGGSLESWDDVVPRFAESRRVLRYDTRGAGMSLKVGGKRGI